ncbi:MAG: TOMM precursor leader peptide-binding protein [Chlamydiales bacterium]
MRGQMEGSISFKECYHVELVEPDMVFLLSERSKHMLRGKVYHSLATLLKDGVYGADEIVDRLDKTHSSSEVYYALERLKQKRHLEGAHSLSKELAAFCQFLDLSPQIADARLRKTKIWIDATDEKVGSLLKEGIKKLGVQLAAQSSAGDLHVVIVEDYLEERLRKINAEATKPWMVVKPYGVDVWIGPLFKPHAFPCWACLEKRLEINRVEESYIKSIVNKTGHLPLFSIASLETNVQTALNLAANEIFKWIVLEGESPLTTKIVSLDFGSLTMQEHSLKGLAACSHCDSSELPPLEPLVLQAHQKGESSDGGNRNKTPEETWEKYKHHVSRLCGAVNVLEKISQNEGSPIHVYTAGHNFALSNVKNVKFYRKHMRDRSGGKGRSDMQAKISGLCEALERFSGICQKRERKIHATYEEIKSQALDPRMLLQFSDEQYNRREELNSKYSHTKDLRHWIPEPMPENLSMNWSPVWSLGESEWRYAPTPFCYYGSDHKYIVSDSNGNAAGNCLEEAILQGFFELVERDCVAIWWYNRIQRPLVDLQSFQDPYFERMIKEYEKRGRNIWVLDITNDLNIPTFCALSRRMGQQETIFIGFGTHFDPQIALSRALSELNQWIWRDEYQEDDQGHSGDEERWLKTATLGNQPYLQPLSQVKTASDYINQGKENLLADIELCQKICAQKGLNVFVLDQTRPEIGLNVVKVIVPGLRHFWSRFAPGRLYDVPVELGWLQKPFLESELNPIFMFL